MKLAIMQPYFFPYLGYFSLIKQSDQFILFDTPQFIRHGWIERNRVLKANGEPLYIKIPLQKHSRETIIKDVVIKADENWKTKILAQLAPYKKKAPYYWKVIALIKDIFQIETENIIVFNYTVLIKTCSYLGINTPISIWSDMDVVIDEVNAPDEWALNICKALGAKEYINPPGGKSFFDARKYEKENIQLKFLDLELIAYQSLNGIFVPGLSIIDVMMFNSPSSIAKMLDNYELV